MQRSTIHLGINLIVPRRSCGCDRPSAFYAWIIHRTKSRRCLRLHFSVASANNSMYFSLQHCVLLISLQLQASAFVFRRSAFETLMNDPIIERKRHFVSRNLHCVPKRDAKLVAVTLSNLNRFSKIFSP